MPTTKKKIIRGLDAYTIKLKSQDAADGFFILATNGQASRLPNNTYVVGKEHLKLLKKAGINYNKISKDKV